MEENEVDLKAQSLNTDVDDNDDDGDDYDDEINITLV
jgi:hypothetical protein